MVGNSGKKGSGIHGRGDSRDYEAFETLFVARKSVKERIQAIGQFLSTINCGNILDGS